MNINQRPITSIHQVAAPTKPITKARAQDVGTDFSSILEEKLSAGREIKVSKHAAMRLEARNITLDSTSMEKLKNAVDLASQKGVRDTLVVMDQVAFVVNVNARTVITAVNRNELKDNVFTNIDGAVFT